jgi:hypothetical protein
MKKNLFFLFLLLLAFTKNQLFAQNVNMGSDDLTSALCHKWVAEYVLNGGMKINLPPGAPAMLLEFRKDNALVISGTKDKTKTEGRWKYDAAKKQVLLTVNGKSEGSVISIKNNELTMLMDTKEATPDDPTTLQIVYKIKEN